jgi:hypothetical protein
MKIRNPLAWVQVNYYLSYFISTVLLLKNDYYSSYVVLLQFTKRIATSSIAFQIYNKTLNCQSFGGESFKIVFLLSGKRYCSFHSLNLPNSQKAAKMKRPTERVIKNSFMFGMVNRF